MPRESFQRELDNLLGEVMELAGQVVGTLDNMVEALETGSAGVANREVGVDARYKRRGAEIEEDCMVLQARQAPVARDLRLIYTIQAVTNHLVRSG
ncbi:MAG: PhoU domain-containing protein, partial [Actinomycetota bacterium]